eukprot:scaffold20657_cov134-Isochrysis_galbana.AAC.1
MVITSYFFVGVFDRASTPRTEAAKTHTHARTRTSSTQPALSTTTSERIRKGETRDEARKKQQGQRVEDQEQSKERWWWWGGGGGMQQHTRGRPTGAMRACAIAHPHIRSRSEAREPPQTCAYMHGTKWRMERGV